MSRVRLLDQLYTERKSIKEFDYDKLSAPPISMMFTVNDIGDLHTIANSPKYAGNIDKKNKMIDEIMKRRAYKRFFSGTNRVAYRFLEVPTVIAKVGIDKVGCTDSPAEYKNQLYIQPFCTKIFEVVPQSGVLGTMERVNPITSKAEFLSVADDIFTLMESKIIGRLVGDDLGSKSYMNFGVRHLANGCTFGPVVLDFPYLYKLDPKKTICKRELDGPYGKYVCGGEIDYDAGFNELVCSCCGKVYTAQELRDETPEQKLFMFGKNITWRNGKMRARVISGGECIMDSGRVSDTYISREEYMYGGNDQAKYEIDEYGRKIMKAVNYRPRREKVIGSEVRRNALSDLQQQYYDDIAKKNDTLKTVKVDKVIRNDDEKSLEKIEEAIPEINSNNIIKKVSTIIKPNGEKIKLDFNSHKTEAEKTVNSNTEEIDDHEIKHTDGISEEAIEANIGGHCKNESGLMELSEEEKDALQEVIQSTNPFGYDGDLDFGWEPPVEEPSLNHEEPEYELVDNEPSFKEDDEISRKEFIAKYGPLDDTEDSLEEVIDENSYIGCEEESSEVENLPELETENSIVYDISEEDKYHGFKKNKKKNKKKFKADRFMEEY